jgi:hypothetical protein
MSTARNSRIVLLCTSLDSNSVTLQSVRETCRRFHSINSVGKLGEDHNCLRSDGFTDAVSSRSVQKFIQRHFLHSPNKFFSLLVSSETVTFSSQHKHGVRNT